jgi:phosphotransferase system  glucose/maltose/N-acetylglucosamine-specific IIC component
MKNFWRIAERFGFLCVIGSVGLFLLNTLAIVAVSFGLERLFWYFQYLNLPLWSVALPVLGIMMFLPLALREAFTYKSAPEEERAAETVDWRQTINKWHNRLHFRPV